MIAPNAKKAASMQLRTDLQNLKKQFTAANAAYDELRAAAERAVVRWKWATAPRYDLNPLLFLNEDEQVGNVVEKPPKDPSGYLAYGFSKADRIVLERMYLEDIAGAYYQTFFVESADRIVGHHFSHDRREGCINCSQLVFAGSSPAYYQLWAVAGWASHAYVVSGGRIRSVTEIFKEQGEPQKTISATLRHARDGRVEVLTQWPGSHKAERSFYGMPPAENPFLR
jgi:hypothetical protein